MKNKHSDQPNKSNVQEEQFKNIQSGSLYDSSFLNLQYRNKRRRFIFRIAFSAFIFIALLIFAIVASFIFLRVEYIQVQGNEFYLDNEILDIADIQMGGSLLLVDRSKIAENVMRENPHIYRVDVELSLPSTVRITITEDSPILYFRLAEHYIVLSRELRVLEVFTPENVDRAFLSRLYSTQLPEVLYANHGQVIRFASDANVSFIVDLIDAIEASPLSGRVNNINMSNRFDIRIRYDERWDIFLGNRHNFSYKLIFASEALQYFVPYATGRMYFENIDEGSAIPDSRDYHIRD